MQCNRATGGLGIALALLTSGCVRGVLASYPDQWSVRTAVAKSQCPSLAGRYRNSGELAAGTPGELCGRGRYHYRGSWECDASLSS